MAGQDAGTSFNGVPMQVSNGPGNGSDDVPAYTLPGVTPASAGLTSSLNPNSAAPVNVPQTPQPSPDQAGQHLVGKAFGHILKGLSGTEQNYSIDPATGKTVVTNTPAPKGQWARGILAAGLLGDQNIGVEHGQHNFAQGLLSGLSGGMNASRQLNQEDEAKKRAQSEQDYVNGLKAQENERQNKELTLREQLNKAQVAHDNIETAVATQTLHQMFRNEEGTANQLLVDTDKDKYQDFVDAGEKPFKEGLTPDEYHQLIKDNPGISAKYVGVATGQRLIKDANGTYHAEPTYSLFSPLTTVPQTLVDRMKASGLDKSSPAMYNELATAAINGSTVDYRKISLAQKEVGKQFDIQKNLDEHRVKMAEVSREQASAAKDWMESQKAKYEFGKEKSADNGAQVYNSHVDPQTGNLKTDGLETTSADFIKNWQAAHADPKTNQPSTAVPPKSVIDAGLKQAEQNRADLNGYLQGLDQYYSHELLQYEKKDEHGNYTGLDPAGVAITQLKNNVVKASKILNGSASAVNTAGDDNAPPEQPNFTAQVKGVPTSFRIPKNGISKFLVDHPEASPIVPPPTEQGDPKQRLIIRTGNGNLTMTREDFLKRKQSEGYNAGVIIAAAPEPWGNLHAAGNIAGAVIQNATR